jgi:hypothetical protein
MKLSDLLEYCSMRFTPAIISPLVRQLARPEDHARSRGVRNIAIKLVYQECEMKSIQSTRLGGGGLTYLGNSCET